MNEAQKPYFFQGAVQKSATEGHFDFQEEFTNLQVNATFQDVLVFARQCESLVKNRDIIFAISTSGQSKNVIQGIEIGKTKGAYIISITGENGKIMKEKSDLCIEIP